MSMKSKLMSAVAGAAFLAGAGAASAEEITVAYFLEWPMPFQYAKEMGTYDKEMAVRSTGVRLTPAPR